MLRSSGLTRTALPRHTIVQICRKGSRSTVCRSAEQEVTTSITIAERPLIDDDVKMKATISALDSLLGSQDTALTSSSGVASSSSPSTSVPAPPRQPASSSPPGGIKLPSLPLGGDGSSNSSSTPRRKPAGLTFDQVMGFSGLAPEVINGRAAMIGFLVAISNELRTGESVFAQMVSGGAGQALIVILAVTIASFAPAIRGIPLDEVFNKAPKKVQEWGPFTAAAEGLNGRLAMLGISLLLFFERAGSTAFFLN
ncbi:hypothetical protein Vretimale_8762 [Volvox reticuliferus]|uniref:Uncharacterized protein n=1 Tax=Volvox reticuliferus TaxID=1737510 RepID=A0A8J4FIM5_9CHLO|nr:hypothetical protein Vretifemale_6290 [Volvox reticuliferus]GIM04214.1 hypothetical protein Vretimale_8762 [Volvox reticuliferus]